MNDVGHDWQTRMNLDNDFNQFREIYISVPVESAWKFKTSSSELRPAKFVTRIISSVSKNNEPSCGILNRMGKYFFIHMSLTSQCTSPMCSIWCDLVIENFPVEQYVELKKCDDER